MVFTDMLCWCAAARGRDSRSALAAGEVGCAVMILPAADVSSRGVCWLQTLSDAYAGESTIRGGARRKKLIFGCNNC